MAADLANPPPQLACTQRLTTESSSPCLKMTSTSNRHLIPFDKPYVRTYRDVHLTIGSFASCPETHDLSYRTSELLCAILHTHESPFQTCQYSDCYKHTPTQPLTSRRNHHRNKGDPMEPLTSRRNRQRDKGNPTEPLPCRRVGHITRERVTHDRAATAAL